MDNVKRYSFWDVFQLLPDGSLMPKRQIHVNGITFGPGVGFGRGVSFGGIDFTQYLGKDIAAEEKDNILIIKGLYQ